MSSITKYQLNDLKLSLARQKDCWQPNKGYVQVSSEALANLIADYEEITADQATAEYPSLECNICGDVAFTSSTNYFTDGEGSVCESCGHPGSVVVEEDGEVWWNTSDEYCDSCLDCANVKIELLERRLDAIAKTASDPFRG